MTIPAAPHPGSLPESLKAGNTVEGGIETEDAAHAVPLHDRRMKGIARRKGRMASEDLPRILDVGKFDREHLFRQRSENVPRIPDRFQPPYGRVAVEDLLEHLGIGHESLTGSDQVFELSLGGELEGMGRPDQVHRDVGVEEDHEAGPAR